MEFVPVEPYVSCYSDDVSDRTGAECLPIKGNYIIYNDEKLFCYLLRLKLETCSRLYCCYRTEHDGILDEILKQKAGKSKKAIYYYKKLVFAAVSSMHFYSNNSDECRNRLFQLISQEFQYGIGRRISPKYSKAIAKLLNCNVVSADLQSCVEGRDKQQIIPLWNMVGNTCRIQRTDMYLYSLFCKEEAEEGLLFYDEEFLDTGKLLTSYKEEYYLNWADK